MTTQPSSTSNSHPAIIFDGYSSSQPSAPSALSFWSQSLQQIQSLFGQNFQRLLTAVTGTSDPIVQQRCDRHGHSYYTIYDPVSQHRTVCASETEVRAWLEQRYYR